MRHILRCAAVSAALLFISTRADATINLVTGPQTTTHAGNIVTNGSFETGAPAPGQANWQYWATGTSLTPYSVPAGWTASGASQAYAVWGSDGTAPQRLKESDDLPDGDAAMYFGNSLPTFVDAPPSFNPDGSVTFPSDPTFFPKYGAAVTLSQTIPTDTNPAPSYKLSFWVSGEDARGSLPGTPGILELNVTNVGGPPRLFVTVPNGISPFPYSRVYEYDFVPANPLLPVTITFQNWGHLDLTAWGGSNFSTEAIIDDVIVNPVFDAPEPSSAALTVIATAAMAAFPRRRGARVGAR